MMTKTKTPSERLYDLLNAAYRHFNVELFDGRLPGLLVTLQRKANSYGYAARNRFKDTATENSHHEIALNPSYFADQTAEQILSVLVHEMTHIEEFEAGTYSGGGYHNKAWGKLMDRVGLTPSHTGEPGGRRTGWQMAHYIVPDGPFDRSCKSFVAHHGGIDLVELWNNNRKAPKPKGGPDPEPVRKLESKQKVTCPTCHGNAWRKPNYRLGCWTCGMEMTTDGMPPALQITVEPIDVEFIEVPTVPLLAAMV